MHLTSQDLIIKYLDKYYDSEKYPTIIDYKERIIEMALKNSIYSKGETEKEIAVNTINNIGRAFQKVLLFERVDLTLEDLDRFLEI